MWGMAGWTGSDDAESLASLQRSIDLGCNFFDTAWAYGDGHSEELLGKALHANSNKELYFGSNVPPKNRCWPSRREFSLDVSYPPEYVFEYVEKSLRNVGVDALDLMQFHTWEDHWLDDDRIVRAVERLRAGGKVRAVGISMNRWEPTNGIRAVTSGLIDAVQVIYNIFDQNPEDELFPACRAHNVAVIARVPFDEGSLTGTLTRESSWPPGDFRNTYFAPGNLRATLERVDRLRPDVPSGMTLPELALRHILSEPTVTTVIPGM